MSRREHKAAKKSWKEHCSKYRAKKKVMKDITNTFIRENTPNSEDSAVERPAPLRSTESALVIARKKEGKKKRRKILKEKDLKIQEYKQKMEKYKKRLQRLEKKDNNNSKNDETPNTKLTRMCDTPATRKDVNSPDTNIITETEISRLCDNFSTDFENTAGPSRISQQQYNSGDCVLVKFNARKKEYRYAAVINQVDNDEGEVTVTFMKICDNTGHKFRMDENYSSDVNFNQILEKLPEPDLTQKGRRLFYYFPVPVPVFEK